MWVYYSPEIFIVDVLRCCISFTSLKCLCHKSLSIIGDVEFKQNKYLPAEKQIVTADPDITSVSQAVYYIYIYIFMIYIGVNCSRH